MNDQERETWGRIVEQCQVRGFTSINVAGAERRAAILAANHDAELGAAILLTLRLSWPWGSGSAKRVRLEQREVERANLPAAALLLNTVAAFLEAEEAAQAPLL